jgi:pyridoxine kinase
MNAYMDEWKKLDLRFDGILTGFLGSPEQVGIVKRFLELFKRTDNITVIDPVMGDYGKLYRTYSPLLAEQMSSLVPYADILTPNLTEACILTGTEYDADIKEDGLIQICEKLSEMGPEKIVISGLERGDSLENFIFEKGKAPERAFEGKVGPFRSGTGDVFSTIIAADAVNGVAFADSVNHASSFVAKVLRRTMELDLPKTDGICFEEFLTEI